MDDSTWISYSRADLITSTTVEGTLYGLTLALYLLCARSLYIQLEDLDHRKHNLITLVHVSLVMVCGLLGLAALAVDARESPVSYVDHVNYPDGGLGYLSEVMDTQPIATMGYAVGVALDILTFGVQIWRLWIIWQVSPYRLFVVIVPALVLLAYIALTLANAVTIAQKTESEHLAVIMIYATTSLELSVTVMVTFLIITRIALVRRRHIKILGQSDIARQYTSIISMLVESYILESLWIIAIIILNFIPDRTTMIFFFDTLPFIQILAYLLVLYRVTTGRGWQEDTERNLTTLQWNRDEQRTTQIITRESLPISHEVA